jgi:DNA-binding GntR family transcriptional regulator
MSIVVSTLARQAYEALRLRILTGEMTPNSPVRQDVIADALGVSTIPLREALSRLEQDGLLASFPNRGYIVRPLSVDEAREVFTLRLKLEPSVVAEAALNATDADIRSVEDALKTLEAAQAGGQPGEHVTANRLFHMALVRPGAGVVTIQILERLHVLAERYVRVHLEPLGRNVRASEEHRNLMSAWAQRDAVRVNALTLEHIRGTMVDLENQLRN